MATATIHFCGFNGFGHFQRSEKVVRTFKGAMHFQKRNFQRSEMHHFDQMSYCSLISDAFSNGRL